MIELWHSNRWFRQRTNAELANAVGFNRVGVDAGRANREMRRRAAIAGMDVYEWLAEVQAIKGA